MSESKLSSVAFIAGLIALIIGFIEAAIRLYIGFTESVPFTLWHAVITFAVYAVPGICAIALGQVLENQTILHHQAQRAQLYLMEIAAEDDPGGGGPVRQETPKPWKCKQCDGLNETDSLYCRHCNGLRNLQAK